MALEDAHMKTMESFVAALKAMDPGVRNGIELRGQAVLDSLRKAFGNMGMTDEQLARVAFTISGIVLMLAQLTPRELAETLDNSTSAYAVVAATLVGLYELKPVEQAPIDPLSDPSLYSGQQVGPYL